GPPYPSGKKRERKQRGQAKRYDQRYYRKNKSKIKLRMDRWHKKHKNLKKFKRDQRRRDDNPDRFKRLPGDHSSIKERSKNYRENKKGEDMRQGYTVRQRPSHRQHKQK